MELKTVPLSLGAIRTRALLLGELDAPTPLLLCFHGWGDSAEAYKRLFSRIDGHLDAVAVDAPGHGEAGPAEEAPILPQWIAAAGATIAYFSARRPLIVIGQSLGGRSALSALAQCPERLDRVERVIAIAPAPLELPPWQKVFVRNKALAESVTALSAGRSAEEAIAAVVERHRRTSFHAPQNLPQAVFDDYARHVTLARAQRSIDDLRRVGQEIQAPLDLAALQRPVDLVWGRHDRLAPLTGAQAYLDALPQARLQVIEDCGHHAHIEDPESIARMLTVE